LISSRAVRRYAKALLKVGLEEGKAEQYGEELSLFNNFLQAEEKLRLVLINPAIHPKQRTSIVEEIAKRLGLSEVIINFLRILVEKNRVKALPDLLQIYRDLLDEAMGRARAVLYTPFDLSEERIKEITRSLEEKVEKKIIMRVEKDPTLIGGVVVKIGGMIYDGSIRTQLRRVRENMLEG